MMKRTLFILLTTLVLMMALATPALAQGPFDDGGQVVFGENYTLEAGQSVEGALVVFGGSVTTEAESNVNGDLVVFGGSVEINGDVDGSVAAVGGSVTLGGKVEGDVAALGGNVSVTDTAEVDGDVATFGGVVNVAEGADVQGRIMGRDNYDGADKEERSDFVPPVPTPPKPPEAPDFNFQHDFQDFEAWPGQGVFGWISGLIWDIISTTAILITLGLISWLVAAFMPEQMFTVRRTLSESAAVSFGVGLVTGLVSLFVGLLLLITICLAVIPILGWILLAIATLFGWIVIGQMLGERLLMASGRHDPGLIQSTVVGVVVLTVLTNMPIIGQIPCIGWILGFVGAVIGIVLSAAGMGAVLLTRFGTRPYPNNGGSSGGPSRSYGGAGGGYSGSRVRWTEPAPDVSDEDAPASDEELKAKIREALAEADDTPVEPPAQEPKTDEPDDSDGDEDNPSQRKDT
jgi:hypothetical protein